jgi:hypothetical protein
MAAPPLTARDTGSSNTTAGFDRSLSREAKSMAASHAH